MKISATIIARDEERNIARAIESLRCCDEIIVVDSGSTDATMEIAANHGARVVEIPWRGYAAQKNYAAEIATHEWVLSIDADEALSEALEGDIWLLKKNGPKHDAYTMPRMAQYLGRWILHSGWYPDRKVRLYRKDRATWVGDFIHESLIVTGSIGRLDSNLLHYTVQSLTEHIRSLDRYTTLAAEEMVSSKQEVSWRNLVVDPAWTFFRTYVLQRGFLDGVEGAAIAYMAALYTFLKYAKVRFMSPGRL